MNPNRNPNQEIAPRSIFNWPSIADFSPLSLFEQFGRNLLPNYESNVEISEDEKNVYIAAQMPGLQAKDIEISIDHNTLWIKGERKEEEKDKNKKYYRRSRNFFSFQLDLPSQVEEKSELAEYKDGILNVTFAKKNKGNLRKIAIKTK